MCLRQPFEPFDFRVAGGVVMAPVSGVRRSSARRAARAALATGLPTAAFTRSEMATIPEVLALPGSACYPSAGQRGVHLAVPYEIEISRSRSENARRVAGDDGVEAACLSGGTREGARRSPTGLVPRERNQRDNLCVSARIGRV